MKIYSKALFGAVLLFAVRIGEVGAVELSCQDVVAAGDSLVLEGDLSSAEKEYRKSLECALGRTVLADTRFKLARVLERQGKTDEALSLYGLALEEVDAIQRAHAHNQYGVLLMRHGRGEEAEAVFEHGIEYLAGSTNLEEGLYRYNYAKVLAGAGGKPDLAYDLYLASWKANPLLIESRDNAMRLVWKATSAEVARIRVEDIIDVALRLGDYEASGRFLKEAFIKTMFLDDSEYQDSLLTNLIKYLAVSDLGPAEFDALWRTQLAEANRGLTRSTSDRIEWLIQAYRGEQCSAVCTKEVWGEENLSLAGLLASNVGNQLFERDEYEAAATSWEHALALGEVVEDGSWPEEIDSPTIHAKLFIAYDALDLDELAQQHSPQGEHPCSSLVEGFSGTVCLHEVEYSEQATVIVLSPERGAPQARMRAKVNFDKAQARIELSYEKMKPAILFGGDVTCYVLWAVTRDGETENLGEVIAATPKNQIIFRTGKKMFALMVTAESIYLAKRPSEIVVFANDPPAKADFETKVFAFSDFAPAPDHAMESITQIAWDSKIPLELLQARTAYDLAGRSQAQTYARTIHLEAKESLDEAEALLKKSPKNDNLRDAARQSVELSNEGINIARERIAQAEMAAIMAQRRAAMLALEEQAVAAEAEVAALAERKHNLERTTQQLAQQKAAAEDDAAELGALLGAALSKVAEARNTAAGHVVSLPGILFDTNEATLKREAEKPLAKLAGILLIMQGLGVTIDGYTDATGSEDWNKELSQARAKAVLEFLAAEGVRAARMKAVGYGPESPIADNATPEGRGKNRRVEIVLAEVR